MVRMAALFTQLLDRKGKIGIGERFVTECEVPPLGVEWLEAVTEHSLAQDHAVLELLLRDAAFRISRTLRIIARVLTRLRIAAEVRMTLGAKPVEGAAHVEFLFRRHVEQRQING